MFHLRILKVRTLLPGRIDWEPPASTVRPAMRSRLDKPYGLGTRPQPIFGRQKVPKDRGKAVHDVSVIIKKI